MMDLLKQKKEAVHTRETFTKSAQMLKTQLFLDQELEGRMSRQ